MAKGFNIPVLIGFILGCELAGIIGSVFTARSVQTWYVTLQKPSFNPPSWLFGPVWIVLYLLMGIAAYLVWSRGWSAAGVKTALSVFLVQLILNTAWSILFFGMRLPRWAFVEILFLWAAIALTIFLFSKLSQTAALLLFPYILWVSFAALLNYSLWRLNS
ncbi:MAG: tryptophan-rich sensory protein [Acidobacteria bacterium]|nr:tryptophan-rich sensory protein [Acidobacteriota bacterium]MBU1339046.1 tryptophan-rich sensory protein [Acidobacteriota bacterium]MBU1475716.1 tryptophan-rich sensory protein [Acidobacteriota bacterium]MBU2437716.1 tryptophan-rich sensory protein [Acidobacteriota bacterium]